MIDPRIEPAAPFTAMELTKIEQILGRPLPEDYRDFASAYGGAFVGGLIDGDTELPILTFFSADAVVSKLETHTDLKSDGVLPFADCELGNLYVIDQEGAVYYINYYGGSTSARRVANRFTDLLPRVVVSDE
jgi:hypothetical protein